MELLRVPNSVHIWIDRCGGREDKIAAIGVRVRRWVSYHGVALNVDCDLSHYRGIVPCKISQSRYGVTSLLDLGIIAGMAEVDAALMAAFGKVFEDTPVHRPPHPNPLPVGERESDRAGFFPLRSFDGG